MSDPNRHDELKDANQDDPEKGSPGTEPETYEPLKLPALAGRKKGRRLEKKADEPKKPLTSKDRLYLLDLWTQSGLPAQDFGALVGVTKFTLYDWKKRFAADGPAGLESKPRGSSKKSVQLVELTKRTILLLKKANPSYGCERISDMLRRDQALAASPATVAKVLHEAGYELVEAPTKPHEPPARRFERETSNELWQTDLFTFVLKRQNRRVYLVAFMDDASRFIVSYGLHASQSTALVMEVLRASIAAYGAPKEILTDNGSQYVTWRGKSAFSKECEKRGIKQIVATPRRPQTLGKVERFWGTLWREFLEAAIFVDLEDARRRIGLFIDHYNFRRTHQGIDGHVPADRFFGAAPDVRKTLDERVAANALDLARHGLPKKPFYLTGQVDGRPFSIHSQGDRLILTKPGSREEVELAPSGAARDLGKRVLEVVASRGHGPGRTLKLAELREELHDVNRAELDAALLSLDRAGAIGLERAIDLAVLSNRDRAAGLEDPARGLLVSVSGRLEPPPASGFPEPICPDGSPAPGLAEEDPGERAPGTSPLDDALGPPSDETAGEVTP